MFGAYLAALRVAQPTEATRTFIRILQVGLRQGEAALAVALAQALALGCWQADGVELLLRQAQEPVVPATRLDLSAVPALAPLAAVTIPVPDLEAFAALTEGGCR